MCPARSSIKVLLVDDNPGTLALSVALLAARHCQVRASVDPTTALAMATEFRPHVLVTDVAMPAMLGVELACRIVEMVPTCRVVFHTGELGLLTQLPAFGRSAQLHCPGKTGHRPRLSARGAVPLAPQTSAFLRPCMPRRGGGHQNPIDPLNSCRFGKRRSMRPATRPLLTPVAAKMTSFVFGPALTRTS